MRYALLICLGLTAACARPTHIELEPTHPVVRGRGGTVQMAARVKARSRDLPMERVRWSVEDPRVATVDEKGLVRPVSGGLTKVIAQTGSVSAEVLLEVLLVEEIRSSAGEVELDYDKGDPVKVRIEALAWDGRVLEDRKPSFTTGDRRICRTDSRGQIWPGDRGETVITATIETLSTEIRCVVK